jgi:uncharacterized protein (DUF885 family)
MKSFAMLALLVAMMSPNCRANAMPNPKQPDQTAATNKFAQLSDQFVHEALTMSPITASYAGLHKYTDPKTGKVIELDAELDDVGPQGIAAAERFYRTWRARFAKETPLSGLNPQDAADYRLIDDQIALSLLEYDKIQSYKHNPTGYVEAVGSAIFLPMTTDYASKDVRTGHIISRIAQIPRFLDQAKSVLTDADPIYISTAVEENAGNINLVDSVANDAAANPALKAQYDKVAPAAKKALADFTAWMNNDLAKRPTNNRTWRLGKAFYAEKFRYVMETSKVTPDQLLAEAESQLKTTRAEMLQAAIPLHKQMFPDHTDHSDVTGRERENKIISEVLNKISDEHPERDQLIATVNADLDGIKQFIRDKKIVALGSRDNLKVIPTPEFMRGVYSVAGFHSAPPLEPTAEAQYWVTPINPKMSEAQAESKLREYNNYTLRWLTIHEALPGHYVQAEHADDVQPPSRRVLRALYGNGPYVEGWAEYIADVMTQAGYLEHSQKFLMMRSKVWLRAVANTILDIKMQTENMTDQQAMDLMLNDTFQTQAEAEGKLQRAKLSSTQLPTYFLGNRQWWTLRRKYEAAKGSSFNLLEFHNQALDQGALPLEYLEQIVLPGK